MRKKKILICILVFVMLLICILGAFVMTPIKITNSDFTLNISIANESLHLGDTLKLTAKLSNKSGKLLKIKYGCPLIDVSIAKKGEKANFPYKQLASIEGFFMPFAHKAESTDIVIENLENSFLPPLLINCEYSITAICKMQINDEEFTFQSNEVGFFLQ